MNFANEKDETKLRKHSVVEFLDDLINAKAHETMVGRWDLLDGMTEIDASHWNKILRGHARLTKKKFRLLSNLLCRSQDQMDILNELFEVYCNNLNSSHNRKNERKLSLKKRLDLLFDDFSLYPDTIQDPFAFGHFIYQVMHLPRVGDNADKAQLVAYDILQGIIRDYIQFHQDINEMAIVDAISAYAYIGYQQGSPVIMDRAIKLANVLEKKFNNSSAITSISLHIRRRIDEELNKTEDSALFELQNSSMAAANHFLEYNKLANSTNFNLLLLVGGNYIRLKASATPSEEIKVMDAWKGIMEKDYLNFGTEGDLMTGVQHARILNAFGKVDEANEALVNCITIADRHLDHMKFARMQIRQVQADVATKEFFLSGRNDHLVAAYGFLNDAIRLAQQCTNKIAYAQLIGKKRSLSRL